MDPKRKLLQDAEVNSLTPYKQFEPEQHQHQQLETVHEAKKMSRSPLRPSRENRTEAGWLTPSGKSAIRRVATVLIPPKFKEQESQTNSKCKCASDGFYFEMMCSEQPMRDYYKKTADQLEDIHSDLNDEIVQLKDQRFKLKKEIESVTEHCHDLREMIEMGIKVKQELVDYDKNVEKIIADDSGVADVSVNTSQCENEASSSSNDLNTSVSSTCTEDLDLLTRFRQNKQSTWELIKAKTDFQVDTRIMNASRTSFASTSTQVEDSWPKVGNTFSRGLSDMYGDETPSKKMKLSEISKRKECKSRYVQASTCCFCDYTESEQTDHLGGREEPNDFDCMHNTYSWRSGIVAAIGQRRKIQLEIRDCENKLPALRSERDRLAEKAEACEELLQQACHTFVMEEGVAVAQLPE